MAGGFMDKNNAALLGEPSKHEMSQIVETVHYFLDPQLDYVNQAGLVSV